MRRFQILSLLPVAFTIGCSALSDPSTGYQTEVGGVASVGTQDASSMSREDLHAEIERAYLDGELTAEQARKAHTQLDVRGHLTQEQIRIIHRDRLAKRDGYETRKEQLDVLRDIGQTGTSVTSDVNNILDNVRAIFH